MHHLTKESRNDERRENCCPDANCAQLRPSVFSSSVSLQVDFSVTVHGPHSQKRFVRRWHLKVNVKMDERREETAVIGWHLGNRSLLKWHQSCFFWLRLNAVCIKMCSGVKVLAQTMLREPLELRRRVRGMVWWRGMGESGGQNWWGWL